MAYPAGVSLAVIEAGRASTFFGDDASLTARVTPILQDDKGKPLTRIIHTATGHLMLPATTTFTAAQNSVLSFSVPHVDQGGWQDPAGNAYSMWAYRVDVTANVTGHGKASSHSWSQNFQPLVGQDFIDLDPIPDGQVGAALSAPLPEVLSINGQTGHVTLETTATISATETEPGVYVIEVA